MLVGWARLELTGQNRVVRGCEDRQRGTREGRTRINMTSQTLFRLYSEIIFNMHYIIMNFLTCEREVITQQHGTKNQSNEGVICFQH